MFQVLLYNLERGILLWILLIGTILLMLVLPKNFGKKRFLGTLLLMVTLFSFLFLFVDTGFLSAQESQKEKVVKQRIDQIRRISIKGELYISRILLLQYNDRLGINLGDITYLGIESDEEQLRLWYQAKGSGIDRIYIKGLSQEEIIGLVFYAGPME